MNYPFLINQSARPQHRPRRRLPAYRFVLLAALLFLQVNGNATASGSALLVRDINQAAGGTIPSDPASSWPSLQTAAGNLLYFGATSVGQVNDPFFPQELWKSDGTADGTLLVKNNFPKFLKSMNGTLFFISSEGLGKSDGTPNGTVLVKAGTNFRQLTEVAGRLFFTDATPGELWATDGTSEGTALLLDLHNLNPSCLRMGWLVNVNGTLFFEAGDCARHGLWRSDGTAAGTVVVNGSAEIGGLPAVLNGVLFFPGSLGRALWRSDGTTAGTVVVKSPPEGDMHWLTSANGRLFFEMRNHESADIWTTDLWTSDGTTEGTVLLRDFGEGFLLNLTDVNGTVFFVRIVENGNQRIGCELWKSDGTVAGTVMVKDLTTASLELIPSVWTHYFALTHVNGGLLFTASDGSHGAEPWVSDGTSAGTMMLQDIAPGPSGSDPNNYTAAGPFVFFTANDGSTGHELWAMPIESARVSSVYCLQSSSNSLEMG